MKLLWAGLAGIAVAAAFPASAVLTAPAAATPPSITADSMQLLRDLGQQCRSVLESSRGVKVDETMARFNLQLAEYPLVDVTAADLNARIAEIKAQSADPQTVLLAQYVTCVFEARLKQLRGNDRILKRSGTAGSDAIKSGLVTAEQWERDRPLREAKAKADEEAYQETLRQLQAQRDRAEAKAARDREREARGGGFNWGTLILGVANAYVQYEGAVAAQQYSAPSVASAPSSAGSYSESPGYPASPGYSSERPSDAHNPANEAGSCIVAIDKYHFAAQGVISNMGAVFRNKCPYSVEVTWCVSGGDCNPGFSNLATVPANSDRGISYDAERPGSITFAACRNGFTAAQSQLSRSMQHACN